MLAPLDLDFPFHVKHPSDDIDALIATSGTLGVPIERDRADRLVALERLLRSRALPLGLIAESDARRLRTRHILDCLRAAPAIEDATTAYDLGSGAGLPGLVLAIAAPSLEIGLIESRRRRVAFLEFATKELGVPNAHVVGCRAEEVTEAVELCFARAFAPLPRAWVAARRLLLPGGRLVYFAGRDHQHAVRPEEGRIVEVLPCPVLESVGPLVIMAR
jgi:16S rRNA (guanine527-N7)-methyltransferase